MRLTTALLLISCFSICNAQCLLDSVYIKSLLIDPTGGSNNYDTNNDGITDSQDEYVELCNLSDVDTAFISGWQLGDDDSGAYPDFVFPDSSFIAPGGCLLVVNDYCPTVSPPDTCNTPPGIVSMNLPGVALLGNSGDVITLANADGSSSCSVVYGNIACDEVDPLDVPPFDEAQCNSWGADMDGCPLLIEGDSCDYLPQALPAGMADFRVFTTPWDEASVRLEWMTLSELNSDYFEVWWLGHQAEEFRSVGRVDAAGHSNQEVFYNFVHEAPVHGVNYYKLKQVDYDGQYQYTDVRSVVVDVLDSPKPAPTVFTDGFRILGNKLLCDVYIYTTGGQLLFARKEISESSFIMPGKLPSGSYILRIDEEGMPSYHRIIKM